MQGRIMRISRIRIGTDGDGITTLVAFSGCPLECKHCINDECHIVLPEEDEFSRYYELYEPEELIEVLQKDDIYYKMSGGGITFGGGEPLAQSRFIEEVCKLFDPDWTIRIETCLNVPWENLEHLIDIVDEWIIDIKDMNPDTYEEYTGKSQNQMIYNLNNLIHRVSPEKILVRVPNIPYYNTREDVDASVRILRAMGINQLDIFDYVV